VVAEDMDKLQITHLTNGILVEVAVEAQQDLGEAKVALVD
jgi:hypothetical protein